MKTLGIDGRQIRLQVWDTAGQERFRTITQSYYKGIQGIILCYDCSDLKTFKNVENWLKQIHEHANPDVNIFLVANKADVAKKEVSTEDGIKFAAKYGLSFFETSAITGLNVTETFTSITQ